MMAARPRVTSRSARIRRVTLFSSVAGYRVLVRTARSTSPARSVDGFAEQFPEGQRLKFVVSGTDDLQPVIMGLDIPKEPAERIVEEKPHR